MQAVVVHSRTKIGNYQEDLTCRKNPMAKKRTKKKNLSTFPIFVDALSQMEMMIENDGSLPKSMIWKLFELSGFECFDVDQVTFLAILPSGSLMCVEQFESIPVVSLTIPFILKPGISLTKKLKWANQQMSEFPAVRFIVDEDGIVIANIDYFYKAGFDSDQFFALLVLLDSIFQEIYEKDSDRMILKPIDFDSSDDLD